MKPIDYVNFDLLIEPREDSYVARVIESPGGEGVVNFSIPFTRIEIEQLMERIGDPHRSEMEFRTAAREFGARLFDAVFKDDVYTCLAVSLREVEEKEKENEAADFGLRIRLRLNDAPELAALPWEYLHHPYRNFLGQVSKTPIVRYAAKPEPIRPMAVKLPLRILIVCANPIDAVPLRGREEERLLRESLEPLRLQGLAEICSLEKPTEAALRRELSRRTYHILHFIGHGSYDRETNDGQLFLEDEEGRARPINGRLLANLLCNRRPPRLVVLNSCDGARTSFADPFSGTAQTLVRAGIAAVIAMQFPISDKAAAAFSDEFYKSIAEYCPVDAALAEARLSLGDMEWGTPALFMRSSDSRLFVREYEPATVPVDPRDRYFQMILDAMKTGDLVTFLGPQSNLYGRNHAGAAINTYPPSDTELADQLRAARPSSDLTRELVKVSEYVALDGRPYLVSKLNEVLERSFSRTSLHLFLAAFSRKLREAGLPSPGQLVVTSNYDDTLEKAFEAEGEPYDLVCYRGEKDLNGKFRHRAYGSQSSMEISDPALYDRVSPQLRTVILRLLGQAVRLESQQDDSPSRPDGYVITEDDVVDHLSHRSFRDLMPVNIKKKLLSRDTRFLFIGCRLKGWNLRTLFRRLWGEEGPGVRTEGGQITNSWAIAPGADDLDIDFWQRRNVKLLDISIERFIDEMTKRLKAS